MKASPLALILLLAATFAPAPRASAQYGIRRSPFFQAYTVQPDVPVRDADPAFPLRLHIFQVRWGGRDLRNHGFGSGNLLNAAHLQGFDFAFSCDYPFVENADPADTYQARWKHEPYELEILTAALGTQHTRTCKLQLAPEARPFDASNVVRYTHGVSSALRIPWRDPDFAYEIPSPDYPVQFHVIDAHRMEENIDHGFGIANLSDPTPGTTLQGADFQYDCVWGFLHNSQPLAYYQGHWIKPGQKLELLLQRAGSDKVDKCQITVSLHPQPYPEPVPQRLPVPAPAAPAFVRPANSTP
jgi:hypothetical protein